MKKTERKGFVMYDNYLEQLKLLSLEEAGELFIALVQYSADGKAPKLKGMVEMAFSFIRGQIDRDAEKYADVCEKRSKAGKKGGRPKKQPADIEKASSEKQKKAKKANINENTNINTNENKNENVSENVSSSVNSPAPAAEETTTDNNHKNCNNRLFGEKVVLTQEQYDSLSDKYGIAVTMEYIEKVDSYLKKHSVTPYSNHFATISKWLEQDNVPLYRPKEQEHSYDLGKYMQYIMYSDPKLT